MKIALITPWLVKCGIYTYCRDLSKALAELGVDVYIVRLPRFGGKTPEILQQVVSSIPVDKIDLIHVSHEYGLYQGLEGGFYGDLKRLGKPIVSTMHAAGNWEVDQIIASASNRVITHNEFCARRFGYPNVILPHGCLGPFKCPPADECKKAWGIDPRAPIVGTVGFISSYKGIESLVEAMMKVKGAGLVIGGGWHAGPETEYIMKLKKWSLDVLPGRCQWLGYIPDEMMSKAYGAIDIFCYPSRFMTESGALLTALSHEKAIIAKDLAPVREKAKQGALMAFKGVRDLTQKIKLLLKDEELRAKLEKGAMEYAEKTSWNAVGKLHLSLYEDVLKKSPKGEAEKEPR